MLGFHFFVENKSILSFSPLYLDNKGCEIAGILTSYPVTVSDVDTNELDNRSCILEL